MLARIESEFHFDGKKHRYETVFSEVQINPVFADEEFAFSLPAGAELKEGRPYVDPRLQIGGEPIPLAGTDINGVTRSLDDYKGKVLLLEFWATWCGPCIAELPILRRLHENYRDQGFEILSVSLDEDEATLREFLSKTPLSWPQILDAPFKEFPLARSYGGSGIPFSVLIGRDGKIAALRPRGAQIERAVVRALQDENSTQTP